MHILETVCFAVIFVLRSIHELADYAVVAANSHISLVLRTLAFWIDAIVSRCIYALHFHQRYAINELKAQIAVRGLFIEYVLVIESLLLQ